MLTLLHSSVFGPNPRTQTILLAEVSPGDASRVAESALLHAAMAVQQLASGTEDGLPCEA